MHQKEIKKFIGVRTIFLWQGNKATLTRISRTQSHTLSEMTHERRVENFEATPGWGAHGKAISILNKWWD